MSAEADSGCISIIVPTLNEAGNIDPLLSAIFEQSRSDLKFEVLIADGGSTDGTQERVKQWQQKASVRLIECSGKYGLAGDVLEGAHASTGNIIAVMDGDLSHPASALAALVAPIRAGTCDMVVGSRYIEGGSTPDWPLVRRLLSRLGGAAAWPFTDVSDPMSGFFAVRREYLLDVDPSATGFKIGLEIMAAAGDNIRVTETPIAFRDRERGQSKIGIKQLLLFARRLMVMAGGAVSMSTATRFGAVGMLGIGIDYAVLHTLIALHQPLLTAHAGSFFCATLFNYVLNSRWSFAQSQNLTTEPEWRVYRRFIAVAFMALFLRGGILALAMSVWGWPQSTALLLGIATGALVNYIGSAFYIFPPAGLRISPSVRWRVASVGVAAYAIVLRLVYMPTVNLIPEEAYYWNYSKHIDFGYLDHPPMVAWLIWLATHAVGTSAFSVRVWALILWAVAAAYCFRLTRNLYGKTSAFIALLLYSSLPFFFATGFLMMPDAPLTAAWAGSLFFLERALLGGRREAWLGAGICLGLGMLSKYSIALLGPAILIFVALDQPSRKWLRSPLPYGSAVIALILFSPVIAWNATHDWASFAFQSSRRVEEPLHFSLHTFLGYVLVLLTPVGMLAAYRLLAPNGLQVARAPFSAIDRRWLFAATFTLFPLSVFSLFSLFHSVKLDWTGPLWLAALPAIASMVGTPGDTLAKPMFDWKQGWSSTTAAMLVIFGGCFHYFVAGLPGVSYRTGSQLRDFPVAWKDFGEKVHSVALTIPGDKSREPLIVGMDKYFIASEIAFYDPDNDGFEETAGRSLFGGDSLMYGFWFPAAEQTGKTMMLVSFSETQLNEPGVLSHFSSYGPVTKETVRRGDLEFGSFYYRIGVNYQAGAPAAAP